ncbi:MAG: hypothetical protein K0S48_3412, partial [Ramlibacter sp.]|nr:hypothetical protein [Ramlibacter sp.]
MRRRGFLAALLAPALAACGRKA